MGLRARLRWFGRMALAVFILASVAFLSAITAMRFAIQGRVVPMPNVAGTKSSDAQAALQAVGLGMKVEDRIYSSLPVDAVVRQTPPAGLQVKVGQRAHVVLSLGPRHVNIPALSAKSLRAARIELLSAGLQVGEISSFYLPGSPTDTVIQQDPPPGSANIASPRIDMLVSLGPHPEAYVMPNVVGLPLIDAQRKLSASGLKLSQIKVSPAPGAAAGIVSSQTPPRGSRIDAGGSVEIQVAQ
jgi:beta-lactam-binding protein with PASTA domain